MSTCLRHHLALALAFIGFATVVGCRDRGNEKAKAACVRNMEILWGAAGSYCLEHRESPEFVCSPVMLSGYLKEGRPPRCPLGEQDYAPFAVSIGPRCPNRPDLHSGQKYPK
jgi:hypothetical protein